MGDLPSERVTIAAPFATTGLDVFGHFFVTHTGRGEKKVWVLIATCLVTRAVALYPLVDMTLSTVIMALVKMHSQFPSLRKIISDNGSNFRGADREIREAVEAWNEQELSDKLSDHGIIWEFGPANCGSFGGVWERLIAIVKNSFKACMQGKTLSRDCFDALCASVAGVVNRRPLTRVSDSVEDMLVLTPAHFIYPYNFVHNSNDLLPPIPDRGDALRSTWKKLRETTDEFFKTWSTQYLETLMERSKWEKSSTKPLKVGDICLIVEPIVTREKWRIAQIEKIIGSDTSHPRRFLLKDAFGNVFDRHVTGLVALEVD